MKKTLDVFGYGCVRANIPFKNLLTPALPLPPLLPSFPFKQQPCPAAQMRLELFFKTASELQTLIALVQGANIGAVNLVNKSKTDPLLQYVRTLKVRRSGCNERKQRIRGDKEGR